MFLLLYISFMLLNILRINCDQTCDCQEIESLREIVQQLMLEQKLESMKLRKIEARQRTLGSAGTVSAERLSKMEAKVKYVDNKLHYLLKEKLDDKEEDIATVLKKTLTSEKLERIYFASEMESQMTEMKENVENFKKETTSEIDRRTENISATQYDFKRDVNEKLEDIKGQTDRSVSQVMKDVTSSQKLFKLEIDEKLEKTKADVFNTKKQIAFTGKISKNIPLSEKKRIVAFDVVTTNLGNAYNTANGIFLCPIHGLYLVTCSIIGDTKGNLAVNVHLNGELIARPYTGSGYWRDSAADTAVVHANAGDAIYVTLAYGTTAHLDSMSRFVVVLLKAD